MGRATLGLWLLCALTGCRTPTSMGNYEESGAVQDARIAGLSAQLGAGDVVEVRVYGEPELTAPYRVSPDGTIDYPFCGSVRVAGLTSADLAKALEDCLRGKYLRHPQVTVFLKELNSRKVIVFGEVQKPGTFPYEEGMTIVQVVSLAGGFTKLATKNGVIVTRVTEGAERKIRVPVESIGQGKEKNFLLQPGDVVFVPESYF